MKKTPLIVIITALVFTSGVTAQNPSYTIKKGDTLYGISRKYNIKIESLKSFNNIDDQAVLYPGMEILIPGGYTVEKGDTYYSIAKKYNTTVDELLSLNSLETAVILKAGQFLYVPFDGKVPDSNEIPPETAVEAADASETATEGISPEESPDEAQWPHSGSRTVLTGKLKGIQIAGTPGDSVVSVTVGTVVWASDYGIYKKLVLVEGQNGLVYGYGGNESMKVRVGDYVMPGSVIGVLGGAADEADAFFFVYKDGKPLDPMKAPRV